jgi:hypothetical protein
LLERAERIRTQKTKDKNKLYAMHAPEVECIVSVWRRHLDTAAWRGEDAGPALAWERSEGVDSGAQTGCQRWGSSSSMRDAGWLWMRASTSRR